MEKNKMVNVTNRHTNSVGYPVPDNTAGLVRKFNPRETKSISFEELEKLSWTHGGRYLLLHYLVIKDEEIVKLLLGDVEPEYFYNEDDVKTLLLNGSLEQLMDCLDFGTNGVIELIKNFAVELEVPDTRKRSLITQKTGFDIDGAIRIRNIEKEDEEIIPEEVKVRRAAPIQKTEEAPKKQRAAATPKYNVVS